MMITHLNTHSLSSRTFAAQSRARAHMPYKKREYTHFRKYHSYFNLSQAINWVRDCSYANVLGARTTYPNFHFCASDSESDTKSLQFGVRMCVSVAVSVCVLCSAFLSQLLRIHPTTILLFFIFIFFFRLSFVVFQFGVKNSCQCVDKILRHVGKMFNRRGNSSASTSHAHIGNE